MTYPTPDFELSLLRHHGWVIGVDEVGRGAIAGPVAVGAVAVSLAHLDVWPTSIRDSKLMTEQSRRVTEPQIRAWASSAVGMATVAEIEHFGITESLALAANRAIGELIGNDPRCSANPVVLLDGAHDWLSQTVGHPVVVQRKADQECVSVAAASVVAKVARDQLMVELAAVHGSYGFEGNKGYASQEHIAALQEKGPCPEHRLSWLGKILADGQLF